MKAVVAILFSLCMLLQAIPVFHFFSEKAEVFCAIIDEEKPGEKNKDTKDDKQDDKTFLHQRTARAIELKLSSHCNSNTYSIPVSPYLKMLTPPPDAC